MSTFYRRDLITEQRLSGRLETELDSTKSVTWAVLKDLRDGGKLVPGASYEITDYTFTTVDDGLTQSGGHVFNIIVTADSPTKLNENARATQRNGDTYFQYSNLSAWKLKYCLDNDSSRFGWAETENGKGVIYEMIDEYGNEAGYDFKNAMFDPFIGGTSEDFSAYPVLFFPYNSTSQHLTGYFYTFSVISNDANKTVREMTVARVQDKAATPSINLESYLVVNQNKIKPSFYSGYIFSSSSLFSQNINVNQIGKETMFLPGNIFVTVNGEFSGNYIDYNSQTNVFTNKFSSNKIGMSAVFNWFLGTNNNTAKSQFFNVFGDNITESFFEGEFVKNTFGNRIEFADISCPKFRYNKIEDMVKSLSITCTGTGSTTGIFASTFKSRVLNVTIDIGEGTHESITFGENTANIKITGATSTLKNISVEKGIKGASTTNLLEIYDASIVNKDYEIKIKKSGVSTRILLLWANDTGGFTGLYKASNTSTTWTSL
jgi:hypothetical protein